MNPFLHTYYGHEVHYLNPKVSEIDIRDIAHVLSRIPRFNGHTIKPYYVAQHLCVCYDNAAQEVKKEALAHDFSEAFACDIPSPLKSLLPQYKDIEQRLERVIAKKFNLVFPFPAGVKEIDMRVLVTEMRDLTTFKGWKDIPFTPLDKKIVPWNSSRAHKEFMDRYNKWKRV
jgi:hypothetical protein